MNLYLLTRTDSFGHDEYDSFVVAAGSQQEAEVICVESRPWYSKMIAESLETKLIGAAAEDVPAGIVLGSFNAG